LQLFHEDTPTPVWATVLALYGIGNGMTLTSINTAIQAISRSQDCGRAAAMYAFVRSLGMNVGVAVTGTVFQNAMSGRLEAVGLPGQIARNAAVIVHELAKMDKDDPLRVGVVDGYVGGFHGVFWVMTGAAAVGLLSGVFIKKFSMDKALQSEFTMQRYGSKESEESWDRSCGLGGSDVRDPFSSSVTSLSGVSEDSKRPANPATPPAGVQIKSPVAAFLLGPGGRRTEVDLGYGQLRGIQRLYPHV
jgi:hypothetical protein